MSLIPKTLPLGRNASLMVESLLLDADGAFRPEQRALLPQLANLRPGHTLPIIELLVNMYGEIPLLRDHLDRGDSATPGQTKLLAICQG